MPNDVISKIQLPNGNTYDLRDNNAIKENLSYSTAAYPYTGQELLFLRNPVTNTNSVTDLTTLLSFFTNSGDTDQSALVHYVKTVSLIASTEAQTFEDEKISSSMVVIEYTFSNPLAQYTDLNITTTDGSVTITGTITEATNLTLYFGVAVSVPPTIQVNLGSTTADSILKINSTPGVFGVLPVNNGGTGLSAAPSLLVRLSSTTAANIFEQNPRPGVIGTLAIENGGTNANNAADARTNLDITPANIGALALTGGTLTGGITLHNSGDALTWHAPSNIACIATANNHEWSFDLKSDSYTGTYWQVWSGANSKTILACHNDDMSVTVPNGTLTAKAFSGPLTGSVTGHASSDLALSGGTMTGKITFNKVSNAIAYTGTKATYDMIKFLDNTTDATGNGISIGGGGTVIIGGGESANTAAAQVSHSGNEILYLCNDNDVIIFSNMQDGWASRKTFTFGANGTLTAPAFSGPLTGNVTGNCSGSSGSCTGHASSDLALSGGTMTGNITYKCSSVNASLANNNVSSTLYPTTFNVNDNANRILTRLEGMIQSDGIIGANWYVRNYNTSGGQVAQKGIQMMMNKSGTLTYAIADSVNFRNAIGASSGTWPISIGGTGGTSVAAATNNLGLTYAANNTDSYQSWGANGVLMNSSKTVRVHFYTSKSMANISTVTVTKLDVVIRGVKGAFNSSTSYTNYVGASGYTVTATKRNNYLIQLELVKSSAFTNVLNDSPVYMVGTVDLKFT